MALLYPNIPTTVVMIELKFAKCDEGDAVSIHDSHRKMIKEATVQVLNYSWKKPLNATQKVVVSGVWHPSIATGPFQDMCIEYEFL